MRENGAKNNLNRDEHELEEIVIEIPEDLAVALRPETFISRVPSSIRRGNKEAYSPQVISIGPLHHGDPELQNMEIQKLRYLKLFCQRVEGKTQKQVVNDLSRIIKESEEKIRRYYYEPCALNTTEFVKMVLLDSVFIIENLLREKESSKYQDDVLISQRIAIYFDLILFENQLPYFIVNRLYDEIPMHKSYDFDTLASSFLEVAMPQVNLSCSLEARHFVDMLRSSFLNSKRDFRRYKLKYSATKLHQAGVKFEAVEQEEEGLILDVEFEDGVLKIPVLHVDEFFEVEFRNVMAFEQIHYPFEACICNFFFLMADLINSEEDVELLVDAGIIVHWLGSNQIFADYISKLCKGMNEYVTCYASVCEKLHEHYENPWNRRKATLRLVYFSNLWRGTATVAASLLLIMTLIQSISDFKSLLYD